MHVVLYDIRLISIQAQEEDVASKPDPENEVVEAATQPEKVRDVLQSVAAISQPLSIQDSPRIERLAPSPAPSCVVAGSYR